MLTLFLICLGLNAVYSWSIACECIHVCSNFVSYDVHAFTHVTYKRSFMDMYWCVCAYGCVYVKHVCMCKHTVRSVTSVVEFRSTLLRIAATAYTITIRNASTSYASL
jgi:hypothetical protein